MAGAPVCSNSPWGKKQEVGSRGGQRENGLHPLEPALRTGRTFSFKYEPFDILRVFPPVISHLGFSYHLRRCCLYAPLCLSQGRRGRAAAMVLRVHLIHRQPFLLLPLKDLEQALLLDTLPAGLSPLPRLSGCALFYLNCPTPRVQSSRETLELANTFQCIFYCLSWARHATFLHSSSRGGDVKGWQLSNPANVVSNSSTIGCMSLASSVFKLGETGFLHL